MEKKGEKERTEKKEAKERIEKKGAKERIEKKERKKGEKLGVRMRQIETDRERNMKDHGPIS